MTNPKRIFKPERRLRARCLGFVLSLGFANAVFAGQGDLALRLPAQTALKQRQFPVRTKEGFLMLPKKLDRKTVAAAIRTDRDSR